MYAGARKARQGAVNGRQIALIHVARAKTGMDEAAYRDMLQDVTGGAASSSKDLTVPQFEECMRRFAALGFKGTGGKPWPPAKAKRFAEARKERFLAWERGLEPPPEKLPLMGKISALLCAQGKSWAYAHGMAQKMFAVEKVGWCHPEQLHAIAAALSIHGRRGARKGESGAKEG